MLRYDLFNNTLWQHLFIPIYLRGSEEFMHDCCMNGVVIYISTTSYRKMDELRIYIKINVDFSRGILFLFVQNQCTFNF